MIRLQKLGMVREVETDAEADRYIALGYEVQEIAPDSEYSKLAALGNKALKAICDERGVAVPGNASKTDMITALMNVGDGGDS